jgi:hypothetical protein
MGAGLLGDLAYQAAQDATRFAAAFSGLALLITPAATARGRTRQPRAASGGPTEDSFGRQTEQLLDFPAPPGEPRAPVRHRARAVGRRHG